MLNERTYSWQNLTRDHYERNLAYFELISNV